MMAKNVLLSVFYTVARAARGLVLAQMDCSLKNAIPTFFHFLYDNHLLQLWS